MADESVDESNKEQLSLFGRFCHKIWGFGEYYLGIVNVEDVTARGLMDCIEQFL